MLSVVAVFVDWSISELSRSRTVSGNCGDPLLTGVPLAVLVGVDEDVPVHVREPADEHLVAHVGHAAVGDLDVEAPQDVVLVVVPQGQLVGAVGHVLDVEGAVGGTASDVDRRVARVRGPTAPPTGSLIGPSTLAPAKPVSGDGLAVLATDVGQTGDGDALDLTGGLAGRGQAVARVRTNPNCTLGTGSPPLTSSVSKPVAPSWLQMSKSWPPSRVVVCAHWEVCAAGGRHGRGVPVGTEVGDHDLAVASR